MAEQFKKLIFKHIQKLFSFYYTLCVASICKSCGKNLKVNGRSVVTKNTSLGDNINFNGMEISGGGLVTIGDNFHSGEGCLMITQNHNYDTGSKIPYDDTYIFKDIRIEDQVWLGSRVIILGGVTIGEGAIIQAGSVVTKDIPKLAIAGGHPAIAFKQRDSKHYEKLKALGLFN